MIIMMNTTATVERHVCDETRYTEGDPANIDAIDAAAEREAAALAWMEDELGIPQPRSLIAKQREDGIVKQVRYPLAASMRAHRKINAHFAKRLRGESSEYHFDPEIATAGDRHRRIQRKIDRARLLLQLAADKNDFYSIRDAQAAGDIGARTLDRMMQAGQVRRVKLGGRVFVARMDLISYLRAKVA